jgi:carbonic anhydrase
MKSNIARFGIAAAALLAIVTGTTAATAAASWTYTGASGANHWGTLDAAYATCADGTAQSPINIVKTKSKNLKNIAFHYVTGEAGVFNNGHTVEAEPLTAPANTSTIALDGLTYSFLQFHFHAPSEHEINGLHYPVEVHFVNKATDGKLAVVGVFIKRGKENAAWKPFTDAMLAADATAENTKVELDWSKLLPANKTTMRYNGSLTTPGCAEGVKWNVMTTPIEMSDAQINTFLEAYSGNNRPVQPLHGRTVVLDSTAKK